MADGSTEVKEMRLQGYITGPYQTGIARLPDGVDDNGMVKITLSRHDSTRRPVVKPAMVEKSPTELRSVRREKSK